MDDHETLLRASGGFRVIVGSDAVIARRDLSAFDGRTRRKRLTMLAAASVCSSILFALEAIREWKVGASYSNSRFLSLTMAATGLLATGFPLGLVLNHLFPHSNSVRVDREKIEIDHGRLGRIVEKLTFRNGDVEEIRFVDEGLSWVGFPSHISINARRLKFKCLQGITADEAGQIMAECRRLGYKILSSDCL
ncbi:MAG TPA: hypothetical protein VGM02_14480 [Acidobacteriaceae bacterium]|jgi:hypothetical protein